MGIIDLENSRACFSIRNGDNFLLEDMFGVLIDDIREFKPLLETCQL